jgi:serine/threonine protein kinase
MEYVRGLDLVRIQKRQQTRMPFTHAAWIIAQVGSGLHHAHEARSAAGQPLEIIHRDVSPGNILVTYDGAVKLVDFGIAKSKCNTTQAGVIKGKISYMSPEQARGESLDRRSDVFSLGVVAWELTTGQRLFRGSSDIATLRMVERGEIVPPSTLVPDFPGELETIIMRALALEREARYPDAASFAQELRGFLSAAEPPAGASELAAFMEEILDRDELDPPTNAEPIGRISTGQTSPGTHESGSTGGRRRGWARASLVVLSLATVMVLGSWWARILVYHEVSDPSAETIPVSSAVPPPSNATHASTEIESAVTDPGSLQSRPRAPQEPAEEAVDKSDPESIYDHSEALAPERADPRKKPERSVHSRRKRTSRAKVSSPSSSKDSGGNSSGHGSGQPKAAQIQRPESPEPKPRTTKAAAEPWNPNSPLPPL